MAPEQVAEPLNQPLEERLVALFAALGVTQAHVAARSSTDWEGLAASHPECIASLTLVCPAAIDPAPLRAFGSRLLVITGEHGPGSRRVKVALPDLPDAHSLALSDYTG